MRHALPALLALACAASGADMQTELAVRGGAHRICTVGIDHPTLHIAVSGAAGAVAVRLAAVDLWGAPAWSADAVLHPDAGGKAEADVPGPDRAGFYAITADFAGGPARSTELGVVPVQPPGQRRESFFASNTSGFKRGTDADLLQRIGMRIQRLHFQPRPAGPLPAEPHGAIPLDFTEQDKALAEIAGKDQWVLPIAGYAIEGLKSPLAHRLQMHGPPRDAVEFIATWESILRHYPEVDAIEFWNEPWIFGWTWAATPGEYRALQQAWCEMALRVHPGLRIVAGNSSMFCEDHLEPYPTSWKGLLQGTSHHPYMGCGDAVSRHGSQRRSMDQGMGVTRRMGLPYYYLTEGGSEYRADEHATPDNLENATKIVQYFVDAALTGCFQANAQWEIGYGPAWTRSDTTFAVMASMLEDRPIVADIWPHHELIWGAIFANPRHVTDAVRALPRAGELSARWSVAVPPERAQDATKVAVVWAQTGSGNDHIDRDGTLTIAEPGDIRAFDTTGREIPRRDGALTVPFRDQAVYLASEALDVVAFRARIAGARLEHLTPVTVYAQSLAAPADQRQTVTVRVENQLNRDLDASVRLAPGGETRVRLPAGRLTDVAVPWPGMPPAADNQIAATVTVSTEAGTVVREQILQVARIVRRSPACDGTLAGWEGVVPVLLDSDRLRNGTDLTQYVLNPNLAKPTGTPERRRVVARVYAAYDDAHVYIAAAVDEDSFANTSGTAVFPDATDAAGRPLPYREGWPDGLHHIRYRGDSLAMSFGFRDRVPGWGRQMADPWAWKGDFYDTDDAFVAHASSDGDKLARQWGEATTRRTAYQTEAVPGVGFIDAARVVIRRDEAAKRTIYTVAIPRSEMRLFDPAAGVCRFAFQLAEDKPVNVGRGLEWAEAAGVFDHWYSSGSFSPSWERALPCQTLWGIER